MEAIKRGAWHEAPSLTERDRVLCGLAEKLSGTPTRMTEKDWEPLRALGVGDEGCLEVAHIVGMGILFGLMVLAFKNDVEKRWDVIVGQVRELVG